MYIDPCNWNYRRWGCTGFNGDGSDTLRVPHGEPHAGKLHVRFDEGAGVPHGDAPLYSTPQVQIKIQEEVVF